MQSALLRLRAAPEEIILLGMEPTFPDPDLGYIAPGRYCAQGTFAVADFIEKPSVQKALAAELEAPAQLADLYETLPDLDFSRDLLVRVDRRRLRVLPVAGCGWSDLGTPERLVQTLSRLPPAHDTGNAIIGKEASVNLASALQRTTSTHWPAVANAA